MQLVLKRTYGTEGTNGQLYAGEVFICHTIELPWKDNQPRLSCIPEGVYRIEKRWSPRFKHHYLVKDVPGRSLILIHPANDAMKELKGCIAPVTYLTGMGRGSFSRLAMQLLAEVLKDTLPRQPVTLEVKGS